MSFNDQNNQNPTGSLNNTNNGNNNNNGSSNLFPASNNSKNANNDCKTSQNCANSSNNNNNANNFLDFDFNDDVFGNHHMGSMMGGAHHNHHQQQQNNLFFDGTFGGCGTTSAAQGQGHIYFAPMKYNYLGQQEEQIFHDKQMNNIPDFDFGPSFFGNNHQNPYSLNPINSLNNTTQNNGNQNGNNNTNNSNNNNGAHGSSSNGNNNNFLTNNFLFSTYNTNNQVDIVDLFPPEPVPKLENKQPSHGNSNNNNNNYYMENADQFSPSHHAINSNNNGNNAISSSQPPIIAKTECGSSNTGLMNNTSNVMGGCNNFIGNTFNMNANNNCMFGDGSGLHMMPPHNPYGAHHTQQGQQSHYGMMNEHSHLPLHQGAHMMSGSNQIPSYHHMGGNGMHSAVPMMHHNQQVQNISIITGNKNNVFSIVKDQQKEKKKDYDKNICRYITRQVVRSFSSPEFKNKVLCLISDIYPDAPSQNILQIYKDVTEFFLGEIENLSGFRALKEMLVVNSELDGTILATQKKIFRDFMRWYLKERYFRNIISGNMKDKLAFIRYKNKIMLHYINKPHKWNSNKKKKLGKISSPTHNASNGVGSAPFSSVNLSKQEY